MSLKASEFLNGNIASKYSKLASNELEVLQNKQKNITIIPTVATTPKIC